MEGSDSNDEEWKSDSSRYVFVFKVTHYWWRSWSVCNSVKVSKQTTSCKYTALK